MRQTGPERVKKIRGDVTLKDIAEVVGKSVAAVSRALNDHDDIGEETRAYIKQVAREMGYIPNPMAQRLRKQSTDTLGLILPVFSPKSFDPYFSELLAGIANEAGQHGFDLLVSTCVPGPAEIQAYTRLMNGRRIDGMVVTRPRWNDERVAVLYEKEFPFVVIGDCNPAQEVPCVTDDAGFGARLVVEHLVQLGHEKIALINTPRELVFSTNFYIGFRDALHRAGLPVQDDFIIEADFSQKEGYRAAQTLLSRPDTPTAIVTADDIIALGAMAAAQDQGFQIGNDLVVTGYGDSLLSEYSQPPLTTIHRPTYTIGQKACTKLVAFIKGEPVADFREVIEPSLVIRQSSDLALWL